jgi:hypothetical protein
MEKGLVRMMGRKDLPGRPMIYGTSKSFLELFGLSALSDLPTLKEVAPPSGEGEGEPQKTGDEEDSSKQPSLPVEDSLVEVEIDEVLGEIESSEDDDAA